MTKLKAYTILITLIVLIQSFTLTSNVFAEAQPVEKSSTEPSVSYVAQVGTEYITVEEYSLFLSCSKKLINDYLVDFPSVLLTTHLNSTEGNDVKQVALENARNYKILLIKAKQMKLTFTEKETQDLDNIIKASLLRMGATQSEQEKILKVKTGLSLTQYNHILKDIALAQKFITVTKNNYKFADSEIKKYYTSNKLFQVQAGLIILKVKEVSDIKSWNEAKKKAYEILAKVRKPGSDFRKVAEQYSSDSIHYIGTDVIICNADFSSAIKDWASNPSRKTGDTGIIKTSSEYCLIKLFKIYTFLEMKSAIKDNLNYEKFLSDFFMWIKDEKFELVTNSAVLDSIILPTYSLSAANASSKDILGTWIDPSKPERYVIISKTSDGYQYEDNEGPLPATFENGILKICVNGENTADAYVDSTTGSLLITYCENVTEYVRDANNTTSR